MNELTLPFRKSDAFRTKTRFLSLWSAGRKIKKKIMVEFCFGCLRTKKRNWISRPGFKCFFVFSLSTSGRMFSGLGGQTERSLINLGVQEDIEEDIERKTRASLLA